MFTVDVGLMLLGRWQLNFIKYLQYAPVELITLKAALRTINTDNTQVL